MTVATLSNSTFVWEVDFKSPSQGAPPPVHHRLSSRPSAPPRTLSSISSKLTSASHLRSARLAARLGKTRSKLGSDSSRIAEARLSKGLAIRERTQAKAEKVWLRRARFVAERVCRLAMHNEDVRVKKELKNIREAMRMEGIKEEVGRKVKDANEERRKREIDRTASVGRKTRDKMERGSRAIGERERSIQERAEREAKKVEEAKERRDETLKTKIDKAKEMAKSPAKSPQNCPPLSAEKAAEKMQEANIRREILIVQRAEQAGMHNAMVTKKAVNSSPTKGKGGGQRRTLHSPESPLLPGVGTLPVEGTVE